MMSCTKQVQTSDTTGTGLGVQITKAVKTQTHTPTAEPLMEIADATVTITPTPTSTPTPTLTPTPENLYLIKGMDFSEPDILTLEFETGGLAGKKLEVSLVNPQKLGEFLSPSHALKLGNGFGVIRPDTNGNLVVSIHSGYYQKIPLEGEILRRFLEDWGNGITYILQRLGKLLEISGKITYGRQEGKFSFTGGLRVLSKEFPEPPAYADVLYELDALESSDIELIRENIDLRGSNQIFFTFCGWGPQGSTNRYTQYRYLIALVIE